MRSRLPVLARAAFVWSGLLLMAAIALLASANLALRVGLALTNLLHPWVFLGLLGVVGCSAAAAIVLVVAWRLASRGGLGLRAAVVGGLLLLAIVRLGIALVIDSAVVGERSFFDALARGILAGDCCFGDRAPGYPLALAGAYAVLGPGATAGELLNVLLGLLAGGALFALLHAQAGARAAVLGLYLLALWPAGALFSNARMSETLYIALLLLAAVAALPASGPLSASVAGGLLAAGQYVRPSTLALLPAYMLARWWPGTSLRRALLRTALPIAVTALLLLAPVVAYNLQAHGEPSLSTTAFGGWSLYVGTDARTGGRYSNQAQAEIDALTSEGLWQDSNAAGEVATARILRDPLLLVRLLPEKFNTLWGNEDFGVFYGLARRALSHPVGTFPTLASNLFYVVIASGAAVVVFRRRNDLDRLMVLCLALTLSVSLIHVFVEVRDRYHAYVTPLFIAVVAVGLAQWLAARSTEGARLTAREASI